MPLKLDTAVQYIKGVGPRRAEMFARVGIHTVEELLKYKPFRYEDRTNFRQIGQLEPNQEAVVEGEVAATGQYTTSMKRMKIFEMMLTDSSGSLQVKFFNQPYLDKVLRKGQTVILYGTPRVDDFSLRLSLTNPEYEIVDRGTDHGVHTGRIVPVYRRIHQMTTRTLRQIIFHALEQLPEELPDPLPSSALEKYHFPARKPAFQQIHFPEPPSEAATESFLKDLERNQTSAHHRFIFEEFFLFQFGLQLHRKERQKTPKNRVIGIKKETRELIKRVLPFRPTNAQKRVLKEIVDDLCSPTVMNRLLQGDVGSGKTIVALQAIIVVVENGYQSAFMAPTEILAEQHYSTIRQYLQKTSYRVALLTSQIKGEQRKAILARAGAGELDLLIGTHAVIQDKVDFKNLGMVVIDEQHRFGVLQRSELMKKGDDPETLVMTATPIPRSLALTLYGDFDLSVLDEMPPGRKPVKTVIKTEKSREEVYRVISHELANGGQVFVVYPLVEESEKVDLRAASEMAKHLNKVFSEHSVGLIHGRLKCDEREGIMQRFKEGEIQLLVSTTVIEVGIDIPNATLMVIEHAERFGLSQLHQLRGRVGRGRHAGLCILMTEKVTTQEAYERLDIMRKTSDGFKIAEKDLEIRGPGEFVGTRQSGMPEFLFGNIVRDRQLLELARRDAEKFLEEILTSSDQSRELLDGFEEQWRRRYGLFHVG